MGGASTVRWKAATQRSGGCSFKFCRWSLPAPSAWISTGPTSAVNAQVSACRDTAHTYSPSARHQQPEHGEYKRTALRAHSLFEYERYEVSTRTPHFATGTRCCPCRYSVFGRGVTPPPLSPFAGSFWHVGTNCRRRLVNGALRLRGVVVRMALWEQE